MSSSSRKNGEVGEGKGFSCFRAHVNLKGGPGFLGGHPRNPGGSLGQLGMGAMFRRTAPPLLRTLASQSLCHPLPWQARRPSTTENPKRINRKKCPLTRFHPDGNCCVLICPWELISLKIVRIRIVGPNPMLAQPARRSQQYMLSTQTVMRRILLPT